MPRFYFHIRDGINFVEDLEGLELTGEKAALDEATSAAREILSERLLRGEVINGQRFEVCDEAGSTIFTLPFRSVLRLE